MFFFIQNPWLLLGLAGAALPVILHLQKRRSAQTLFFPSLELLASIHRTKRFSLRLREILLLIIRVAMIVLLALGLAGLQFERKGVLTEKTLTQQSPPNQILLIDVSYSMGYLEDGRTCLERALEKAKDLVKNARAGQRLFVVPFSDGIEQGVLDKSDWSLDMDASLREIDSLKATGEKTNVVKTIKQITSLINDPARTRLWIFSDLQRTGWLEALEMLEQDSAKHSLPETVLVPLSIKNPKNIWIEREHRKSSLPFARGEGIPLPLTVCASGYLESDSAAAKLVVEGQLHKNQSNPISCSTYDRRLRIVGEERQRLDVPLVPLGEWSEASAPIEGGSPTFATWKGKGRLELESGSENLDHLSFDNSVEWSIPVLWSLPVALLRTEAKKAEGQVLEACLSPFQEPGAFFVDLASIPPSEILGKDLSTFSTIVLQEGAWDEMDGPSRDRVLRFIREGGTAIAFSLSKASVDFAKACGVAQSSIQSASKTISLGQINWTHPVFLPLRSFAEDALANTTIYDGASFSDLDQIWIQSGSLVSGPSPEMSAPLALVGEKSYGHGKVVFWGIGLDGEKSDLASSVILLPLLHQTLKHLVADKLPKIDAENSYAGERTESHLAFLDATERRRLNEKGGLLVLEEGASLVGRKRTDLTSPFLMLVLLLGFVELWAANRRV